MKLLLFLLFVGLLIYLFFYEPSKKERERVRKQSPGPHQPRRLVRDPVCNLYLPEEDAIKLSWKGQTYYFCSEECKRKFIENERKGRVN